MYAAVKNKKVSSHDAPSSIMLIIGVIKLKWNILLSVVEISTDRPPEQIISTGNISNIDV